MEKRKERREGAADGCCAMRVHHSESVVCVLTSHTHKANPLLNKTDTLSTFLSIFISQSTKSQNVEKRKCVRSKKSEEKFQLLV